MAFKQSKKRAKTIEEYESYALEKFQKTEEAANNSLQHFYDCLESCQIDEVQFCNDFFEKDIIISEVFSRLSPSKRLDLYQCLKKNQYYEYAAIKEACFRLSRAYDGCYDLDETIEKIMTLPWIQDVNCDHNGKIQIHSNQLGDFHFYIASEFYKNNPIISSYINQSVLPQRCHQHSEFLLTEMHFPAIISLCRLYFRERYHHSYSYSKEDDMYVDLCNNMVMEKEMYQILHQPKEITMIEIDNYQDKLNELGYFLYDEMFDILRIALYEEHKKTFQKVYGKKI